MSRFGTIARSAVIGVFAVSSAVGIAQADDTVTQQITSGSTLTAVIADASLTSQAFSNAAQTSAGTLVLTVEDARGTNTGWYVTVLAADFSDGSNTIPATGFSSTSYANLTATVGSTTGVTPGTPGALGSSAVNVLEAAVGSGSGVYTMDMTVSLNIPAQQPVGSYVSELTVTIADGEQP